MEVVDPALQRDREVDEVGLAAAEQHELAAADAAQGREVHRRDEEGEDGDRERGDRDPRGRGRADVHQPSVKKTV